MENYLNTCLHIEFYGLPGSGKTTISKLIAKELTDLGYSVVIPGDVLKINGSPLSRKIMKISTTIIYCIFHPILSNKIRKLIIHNGNETVREQIAFLVNLIPQIKIYNKTQKGSVVVWDQGIIQSSISLSIGSNNSSNMNEAEIHTVIRKEARIVRVYIKETIETALERMSNRITNDSRVEKANSIDKKKELLQQFEAGCESVIADIVVSSNGRSISEMATDVLNSLEASYLGVLTD